MKNNSKFETKLQMIFKQWVILLIWAILLLFIFQVIGIIVHEVGHYSTGKIFGCDNLVMNIAKFSWEDTISGVFGWENCQTPLVMAKDGSRVCNAKTNIISFSGLLLTLLFFIPLIILINNIIKKKFNYFYLKKRHLILILIYVVIMAIYSARIDFFKIGECLVNLEFGNQIFIFINLLQSIFLPLIIFISLLLDCSILLNRKKS